MSPADEARLREQRAVVEKYLANDDSREKYTTPAGKLGTIRAILAAKVFAPTQTYELQSLGVVLGDALVLREGMEWVIVADSLGRDPALRAPGTSIIVYPLTMISKRVEKGETVDVFALFDAVSDDIERLRREGR
jgi:hypothetical protein